MKLILYLSLLFVCLVNFAEAQPSWGLGLGPQYAATGRFIACNKKIQAFQLKANALLQKSDLPNDIRQQLTDTVKNADTFCQNTMMPWTYFRNLKYKLKSAQHALNSVSNVEPINEAPVTTKSNLV